MRSRQALLSDLDFERGVSDERIEEFMELASSSPLVVEALVVEVSPASVVGA